jgi:hypothetical protein
VTGLRYQRWLDAEPANQIEFYRKEIHAVIDLELAGVRCPSTFDGGAYLRECIREHREAMVKSGTFQGQLERLGEALGDLGWRIYGALAQALGR